MTPEQPDGKEVVRVLATKLGYVPRQKGEMWEAIKRDGTTSWSYETEAGVHALIQHDCEDLLHSTDSLRPVVAKLTLKEMQWVEKRINGMFMESGVVYFFGWLMNLSPETWARTVAQAILACRKEGV